MDSTSSSTSLNKDTDSVTSSGGKGKAIKEGAVQMTSLSSLVVFHRYFFLYQDVLVVSKQKGVSQFKLKEKHRLSTVWVAVHHPSETSFLLGWPLHNFLVHFRSREDRDDWFELFSGCIQRCTRPVATTIPMHIHVRGRKQVIRRQVVNGKKTGELIVETAADLGLPNNSYELRVSVGENHGKALQGPENVYAVIMHRIDRSGVRLSESQRQALDACPFAQIKLILSTMKTSHTPTPIQIVNSIRKKVLQRSDSRGFIGKDLDGPTPPQPIMTIVDHLRMKGFDSEGIFRKSPKQSTFKELRAELERGVVPDFNKYSTHVLASMLKEYLRGIPGKILQSSNYELWMREVVEEHDHSRQVSAAASLVKLLPSSHAILLANVLKLLNKVAESPESKMSAAALSVCLAPSFLESSDPMEGGKKVPLLVEFLIENAADVVPGFCSDNVFSVLHPVDMNANIVCGSGSVCSDDDTTSQKTPIIEEIAEDNTSASSIAVSSTWSEAAEPEPPLNFSSSEDEEEDDLRPLSFLSDTLRSEDTLGKEKSRGERSPPLVVVAKEEKEKTPRSPCLKRIHFQRSEAALRSSEVFSSRGGVEFKLGGSRKNSREEAPSSRKESREEGTQTPETMGGIPSMSGGRFPAFRSNLPTLPQQSDEKPVLQVPPFSQEKNVQEQVSSSEPSLQSISERLAALRERSRVDTPESPKFLRKISATQPVIEIPSTAVEVSKPVFTRFPEMIKSQPQMVAQPPKAVIPTSTSEVFKPNAFRNPEPAKVLPPTVQAVSQKVVLPPVAEPTVYRQPELPKQKIITEKFSPYCIEPMMEYIPEKKSELQRSSSQRGEKYGDPGNRELRELQRASSVRNSARRERGCVGMEPLEINWSVRHLKTLFQDKRAPAIDTDYTTPF